MKKQRLFIWRKQYFWRSNAENLSAVLSAAIAGYAGKGNYDQRYWQRCGNTFYRCIFFHVEKGEKVLHGNRYRACKIFECYDRLFSGERIKIILRFGKIAILPKRTPFVAYIRPRRVNAGAIYWCAPERRPQRAEPWNSRQFVLSAQNKCEK